MRPLLLDLFCGAGGVAEGYDQAGFRVVGVDIKPQPRYPFRRWFWQGDALRVLDDLLYGGRISFGHDGTLGLGDFDGIHASPPCQRYSDLAWRNGNADEHPDLIGPVRELLQQTGLPYVIENVEGAPLLDPELICGTERGLRVDGYRLRRHRLFETNWPLRTPGCGCTPAAALGVPVIDVSGGGPSHAPRLDGKGGRTFKGTADQVRRVMGMPWATKAECNEAVPPAYTRLIGEQLLAYIDREAAA